MITWASLRGHGPPLANVSVYICHSQPFNDSNIFNITFGSWLAVDWSLLLWSWLNSWWVDSEDEYLLPTEYVGEQTDTQGPSMCDDEFKQQ